MKLLLFTFISISIFAYPLFSSASDKEKTFCRLVLKDKQKADTLDHYAHNALLESMRIMQDTRSDLVLYIRTHAKTAIEIKEAQIRLGRLDDSISSLVNVLESFSFDSAKTKKDSTDKTPLLSEEELQMLTKEN